MKSISASELAERLRDGVATFMLDVREVEEMEDGRIAGSINIPMGDVEARLGELPEDRDIVVICHRGTRSAFVTRNLGKLGYTRAVNLDGGMDAWLENAEQNRP